MRYHLSSQTIKSGRSILEKSHPNGCVDYLDLRVFKSASLLHSVSLKPPTITSESHVVK